MEEIEKMILFGMFGPLREVIKSHEIEYFFNRSIRERHDRLFEATLKFFHELKDKIRSPQYVLDSALQTAMDTEYNKDAINALKAAGASDDEEEEETYDDDYGYDSGDDNDYGYSGDDDEDEDEWTGDNY